MLHLEKGSNLELEVLIKMACNICLVTLTNQFNVNITLCKDLGHAYMGQSRTFSAYYN